MVKKFLFLISIIALGLPIFAQPAPFPPKDDEKHERRRPEKMGPDILNLERLNLTEEQNAQISQITEEYKKKIGLIIIEMDRNKLDFDEAMLTDNFDFEKLKGIIEKRKSLESNVLVSFLERDLKIKDFLTEKQWKIFKEHFSKAIDPPSMKDCPKDEKDSKKEHEKKSFNKRDNSPFRSK